MYVLMFCSYIHSQYPISYSNLDFGLKLSFVVSSARDSFSSREIINCQSDIMVGVSNEASSSRMQQLTKGRRLGFRGLIGANRYLLFSSLFACIGSFMYGTDQGILSNLLTGQNFGSKFPSVYSDPVLKGWVVSCLQLGAWLGALANGPLANAISRKYSLTVAAFVG